MFYSPASSKNNNTFVSRLLIGQLPHACQSQAPLQAAAKNRCKRAAALLMKQNIEIYLADAVTCTPVVLVLGISNPDFFKFWRNLVIPIGMAEYCVKSGRIPPKSEWLAAMQRRQSTCWSSPVGLTALEH